MPDPFQIQPTVHANVRELRRYLGSVTRPLSPADLAELLNQRDPKRKRALSTVQRWEQTVTPDLLSIKLMAEIAGVTFEEFALGKPAAKAPPRQETTAHYERAGRGAAKKAGRKAG